MVGLGRQCDLIFCTGPLVGRADFNCDDVQAVSLAMLFGDASKRKGLFAWRGRNSWPVFMISQGSVWQTLCSAKSPIA